MTIDLLVLNGLYNVGKILGNTPINNTLFSVVYLLILSIIVPCGLVLSFIDRNKFFWESEPTLIEKILVTIELLIANLFALSCFLTAICRRQYFFFLLHQITEVARILTKQNRRETSKWFYIINIGIIHVIFISIHLFQMSVWWKQDYDKLERDFILIRILSYNKLFITLFVLCITKWLKQCYNNLNKWLIRSIKRYTTVISISQDMNRNFLDELRHIKAVYGILNQIINNFNDLFGWQIFFLYLSVIISYLQNLDYIVRLANNTSIYIKTEITISSLLETVATLVSIIKCKIVIGLLCKTDKSVA